MQRLRSLLPGSALYAVVALAASFVAQLHGGPPLLYALMMGMTLHAFGEAGNASAGVEFASSFILRLGVALLGARITAEQVMALGWPTVALVLAAVASTIGLGIVLARWLGLSGLQGLLSGGATAICGASAALAIAAVLPRSREQDRFTLLVVVCVSTLSTLAMLLYPPVARLLGLPPALAGLFIGASIHDVAQVVGAGYQLGTQAGDAAVIVKLLRVSLLVWVVLGVSVVLSRRAPRAPGGARRRLPGVPWFLTAFVALAVLNSLHGIPDAAQPVLSNVSRACLVVAIAALGLKTALPSLAQAGWRPLVLLLCETLWIAAFTLIGVAVLSARGLPA